MRLNLKEFLTDTGLDEPLYPGKRLVKKLAQTGEHKSHCVVYDWRAPETLRVDVKAGLSGKDMPRKDLAKYPVSFQAPTYFEIDTSDADSEEDTGDEEEGSASGSSSGGGGKKVGAKKSNNIFSAFSSVVEGKIPGVGEVKKLVVMGKDIAKTAFEPVIKALVAQIKSLTVAPVNALAAAVKVTVATPGGRDTSALTAGQLEGADVQYKPKDMFGVNPT